MLWINNANNKSNYADQNLNSWEVPNVLYASETSFEDICKGSPESQERTSRWRFPISQLGPDNETGKDKQISLRRRPNLAMLKQGKYWLTLHIALNSITLSFITFTSTQRIKRKQTASWEKQIPNWCGQKEQIMVDKLKIRYFPNLAQWGHNT